MRAWVACILLLLVATKTWAQHKATEEQVKAAYVYNFGKFATWPPSGTRPQFTLCVIGEDEFRGALESTVANEQIKGVPIRVLHLSGAQGTAGCQIAYVSQSEAAHLPAILSKLGKQHVLTVSDIPGFIDKGGMIGLVREGPRVRFAVDLKAVEEADLSLSSELLKVAMKVQGGPGGVR